MGMGLAVPVFLAMFPPVRNQQNTRYEASHNQQGNQQMDHINRYRIERLIRSILRIKRVHDIPPFE